MTDLNAELVVIGSGPGGYSAAFRAADLGINVVLVERYSSLGGVCLNVGCIPSKFLLHIAKVLDEAKESAEMGISFSEPNIDIAKINEWKDKNVVGRLTSGLKMLAKQRKVQVIHGEAKFISNNQIIITGDEGTTKINFQNAIVAVGSRPVKLPFVPEDSRIFDSTGALKLNNTI